MILKNGNLQFLKPKKSQDLCEIHRRLDQIAENHLHELPEMKQILDRMEVEQVKQGNRLTSVETKIEILLK